ncbi:MAG TPA: tetratricopeptide repeat protein [Candidatus Acidoferrales bacterium]|nr:tetratricopeptide repeat protein [Candidatus Acidoferrales bacterium]
MTRPLFEQYKEALRRGHVALLGGELETALAAYREAAALVPDRPLPHTSMGSVLHQLGRRDDALAAFDRALVLAPDDEAALAGRATLVAGGGAAAFEAGSRTESGSPVVAAEPAPTPESAPTPEPVRWPAAAPAPAPESAPAPELLAKPAAPEPESAPAPVAAAPPPPEPEPPAPRPIDPTAWPAIDLPSPPPPPLVGPPPDPAVLQAEAEALIDAGDARAARDVLLLSVAVHRAAGRLDAALDSCLQLLTIVPGDPRVHLEIANLQLDRGWRSIATEKIELLLRLTSLSGDTQAEADVHLLAADRLRDASGATLDARKRGVAAT